MSASSSMLEAAQDYIGRGWPVLPVKPGAKVPLTTNGVRDATCDERTILHWWERWPHASVAIATGAPGPTVLDIDDLEKGKGAIALADRAGGPVGATNRGRHYYFKGLDTGTVDLKYGELRGRGSYVVAPPSIHASGKQYVWLSAPIPGPLPQVPASLMAAGTGAGQGPVAPPRPLGDRIPEGSRHSALTDRSVRLVRGGITDPAEIAAMLAGFADACCAPGLPRAEIDKLARWAASTDMADRERQAAVQAGTSRSLALVLGGLQQVGRPYSLAVSLGTCPACGAAHPFLLGDSGTGLRMSCERGCPLAQVGDALHDEISRGHA